MDVDGILSIPEKSWAEKVLQVEDWRERMKSLTGWTEDRPPTRWALIAAKISAKPSFINVGLANIERYRKLETVPDQRLDQWERLLADALAGGPGLCRLLEVLKGATPENERLLDFAPLAGILTAEEKNYCKSPCAYQY